MPEAQSCRRGATLQVCAALATLWLSSLPLRAMTGDFAWSLALQQRYEEDIFRTGEQGPDDHTSSLRVQAGWTGRTPRSSLRLQYLPEYVAYAQFDTLNRLDHQFNSAWQLAPGKRSTLGIHSTAMRTEQQPGFQDFEGGEADPIVERTLRTSASIEPFYSLALSRRWQLDTRAGYREQRYDSDSLVDTRILDLELATTAQVSRSHRVGGRIAGSSIDQEDKALQGSYDSFLRLETLWSWTGGSVLSGSARAGAFRANGDGVDSRIRPTFNTVVNWSFARSRLAAAVDAGFAGSGGSRGTSRSQSGHLSWTRGWGKGLRTGARASYIRREPLDDAFAGSEEVRGYGTDLNLAYVWSRGVGILVQHGWVNQDRSAGTDLDYQSASVSLTYAPRGAWGTMQATPGSAP